MNKPNGYDEAQTSGYTPADLGGHKAIIKQVAERQSSTGKPMVVVLFDFDQSDRQPGYFSEKFKADDRLEKKWPYAGTKYIMVNDYADASKTSKDFKTFCTCFENSNGCQMSWGGNWAAQFKNRKIGVVFGEEESEYNGDTSMRVVPRWFCDYDKADSQPIPKPKYLKKKAAAMPATDSQGFMNLAAFEEEELPF